MEKTPLTKLELRAPLDFVEFSDFSSVKLTKNEEILLCYDLNPAQNRSIEPDSARFLGSLVFAGRKTGVNSTRTVSLPAGTYLFIQGREAYDESSQPATLSEHMDAKKWLDLALEQHKDALWERHKPGNRLYLRFLFEDGGLVTQVFRVLDNSL
jgi:hypothetical protein